MKYNRKKIQAALDLKDIRMFYKTLQKFKQRHPNFDIEAVMKKLYPEFVNEKNNNK